MKKIFMFVFFLLILCGCNTTKDPDTVINALVEAKLPMTNIIALTAENDSNQLLGRPHQYVAKVDWMDTRIANSGIPGKDTGGTLEVFLNAEDMKNRKDYLEAVTKGFSPFAEYSYGNRVLLLRLSHKLTPTQAKEYEDVFMGLP
ncbi:MAG: hypothetical protein WCQ41_10425 [Bacillota bacterium]